EFLVKYVCSRTSRTIAGKTGNTTVRVDNLTFEIALAGFIRFDYGKSVTADAGMAFADFQPEISLRDVRREYPPFDNNIIVTETVEFAEWY
ncbi:hypothetical protein OFM04_31965, partial [Escherichia coli]|nr:hypothetical protein [Escherichia coli]